MNISLVLLYNKGKDAPGKTYSSWQLMNRIYPFVSNIRHIVYNPEKVTSEPINIHRFILFIPVQSTTFFTLIDYTGSRLQWLWLQSVIKWPFSSWPLLWLLRVWIMKICNRKESESCDLHEIWYCTASVTNQFSIKSSNVSIVVHCKLDLSIFFHSANIISFFFLNKRKMFESPRDVDSQSVNYTWPSGRYS